MDVLIAIDHGNYSIKTPELVFRAGLAESVIIPALATDLIEYQGRYYTLSDKRIAYMEDKTKDDSYFILTLFAIAKTLAAKKIDCTSNVVTCHLAIGLPPEHYGKLKDSFASYFKRDGVIAYKYGKTEMSIEIGKIYVYPQGYAAATTVWSGGLLTSAPIVYVVDIGGYTTDVFRFSDGKPDLSLCFSLEDGAITTNHRIIHRVKTTLGTGIEDAHIQAVLEGKPLYLKEGVRDIIADEMKKQADVLVRKLREEGADLGANPCLFVGGGAAALKQYLENHPEIIHAEFIDDSRANAKGYEMMATFQLHKEGII